MAEAEPTDLIRLIQSHIIHATDEHQLQDELEKLFKRFDIPYEREVVLSPTDRIDFVIESSVGVEVKVDGSWTAVSKQLQRYASHNQIKCLILITTRSKHRSVPTELGGKTVYRVILLNRGF